ncbi:MAG: hypothetical protein Q9184_004257 [Pyrenodesmia sp. 2 TL-2023]
MTSRRAGTQPYIPKLTYRNNSIIESSTSTIRSDSSAASISTCATSPQTSSFGGSPRSFNCSDGPLSPLSLDGASDREPLPSPRHAKLPQKKPSFFGFLSVKEPSTQAFEAYQEQMKRRGTTQSGRANAVGLPGVSSAKLPPTVPKVNSRWDGVPQTAKEKLKKGCNPDRLSLSSSANRPLYTSRSTGSNMSGMTTDSTRSGSSTGSAPRVNGKLKYDNDNQNLSEIYGWETLPPSNGSSTRSLPLEPRGSAASTPILCRNSPILYSSQTPKFLDARYELESPPPLYPSSNLSSPGLCPALPSPVTPSDSTHDLPTSPSFSYFKNAEAVKETSAMKEGNNVVLASSGVNVLGPPVSATQSVATTRSPAIQVHNVDDRSSNAPVRHPSPQPKPILRRPVMKSSETWPVQPPSADTRDGERAIHTPATMSGSRARFLSILGKGS